MCLRLRLCLFTAEVVRNIGKNLIYHLLKGRNQQKIKVLIRALPELAKPPPHPPIRAPWSFFSGRQKRRFARMMEKNTDDDNNRCHNNFDQNFGNFDDNDDKNY